MIKTNILTTEKISNGFRKTQSALVFCFLLVALPAFTQVQLAGWSPTGLSGFGTSPWGATATDPNMTVGGWTRGAGVGTSNTAAGNAWGGHNWAGSSNQDATFTITSNPGTVVSYSAFNLFYRRSSTGPATGTFEYAIGSSTTYVVIDTFTFSSNSSSGAAHTAINLSTVTALQNMAAGTVVNFRIFPTGGGSAGTWYIFGTGASLTGSASGMSVGVSESSSITCNGLSNGALTASVNGGTSPYSYSWSPAGGTSSVAASLSAGVYTCFVSSLASQTAMATYTLTEPAVISVSVASVTNVTCNSGSDGSAAITGAGGTPPYTYSWAPGNSTSATAGSLTAGAYTAYVSDSFSCPAVSQTLIVTQPTQALVSTAASNTAVCNGYTVVLNGAGATTYTWSGGVVNNMPFTPTATASYTVIGNDTISGCSGTATITVDVYPTPIITVTSISGNMSVCKGYTIALMATGANTYTWSHGLANGSAFTLTSSASYSVIATDTNNCYGSATVSVTVKAIPSLTIVSGKPTLCKGEATTLTAGGAANYTWSTNSNNTHSTIIISPTVTTTYSLTGKSVDGCVNTLTISQKVSPCAGIDSQSAENNINITIFPNPNAGAFTIKAQRDVDLVLVNELGQVVKIFHLVSSNSYEQQVYDLDTGVYFLFSTTGNDTAIRQKIIVTK